MRILIKTKHMIIAKTIRRRTMLVMGKFSGVAVYKIYAPREGSDPHILFGIPVDRIQGIGPDTGGIHLVMKIGSKKTGLRIQNTQPGIFRPDPEIPFRIFG